MSLNPVLEKLGFNYNARVAIIHADDVGMCQATLPAFEELIDFGLLSSGAVMVPCAWFPQTAVYCQQHPQIDMGVHLTLTSEWDSYRWRPVSTCDPASGLLDNAGYFPQSSQAMQKGAVAMTVQTEIEAQITRALTAGIDVTHIDSHMFSLFHPPLVPGYLQLAKQQRLPLFMLHSDTDAWYAAGIDGETAVTAAPLVSELETQGFPIFDCVREMPLDQHENRIETAKRLFDSLPPGLSLVLLHPAQDTPELRAIAPDWPARVADYQAFMSQELRDHIQKTGIYVISYRDLRNLMRET